MFDPLDYWNGELSASDPEKPLLMHSPVRPRYNARGRRPQNRCMHL